MHVSIEEKKSDENNEEIMPNEMLRIKSFIGISNSILHETFSRWHIRFKSLHLYNKCVLFIFFAKL